jgi:eukaryotic-like serine/threonine-protein kinase
MSSYDYKLTKRIFHAAIDLAPEERSDFLNENCRDNEDLRREVEKLLNYQDTGFLEQPAIGRSAEQIINNQLKAGQEIGHYKIISALGAGGMSEVYLAEDLKLNRRVALKVLPRLFSEDKERMRRFLREAEFFSSLNHPNIVTIFEVGEVETTHFIVTEFIEGETLHKHAKGKKLSVKSALDVSIQIVSALQSAHGAGIVHRDIKPDNIMIRPDGIVKILDFGVAKLIEKRGGLINDTASASVLTKPGMIIGTVNYMSPEQARGGTIDVRSDIWSFGVVLHEMLSGKQLFQGDSKVDVISSILREEPVSLHQLVPEVPHLVERIVKQAVAKNREDRYQTTSDLLRDLKDVKQSLELHDLLERSIEAETGTPNA